MRVEYDSNTTTYSVYISTAEDVMTLKECGAGTAQNPVWGSASVPVNVYLEDDIDMSSINDFGGISGTINLLNGQGHSISNITHVGDQNETDYFLFSVVKVSHLTLSNLNITTYGNITVFNKKLIVEIYEMLVEKVKIQGNLTSLGNNTWVSICAGYVGGTGSTIHPYLLVRNSSFYGNITAPMINGWGGNIYRNAYSYCDVRLINSLINATLTGSTIYLFGAMNDNYTSGNPDFSSINSMFVGELKDVTSAATFSYPWNNYYWHDSYVYIINASELYEEHGDSNSFMAQNRNSGLTIIGETGLLFNDETGVTKLTFAAAIDKNTYKQLGWPI